MLDELDDLDWAEAFGDRSSGNTNKEVEAFGCSDAPFSRDDVVEIIAMSLQAGDFAECNCAGVFRLRDGRYAAVLAWCDTTGWDCQAGNILTVASDLDTVLKMGLSQDFRGQINVELIRQKEPTAMNQHPDLGICL